MSEYPAGCLAVHTLPLAWKVQKLFVFEDPKRSSSLSMELAWNSHSSELLASAMKPSMLVAVKYCVFVVSPESHRSPTLHSSDLA